MALLWKMICNLGDPMSLRHPVTKIRVKYTCTLMMCNMHMYSTYVYRDSVSTCVNWLQIHMIRAVLTCAYKSLVCILAHTYMHTRTRTFTHTRARVRTHTHIHVHTHTHICRLTMPRAVSIATLVTIWAAWVQFYMLQCVAVCCSILQYVAVCFSMLQCVAVNGSVLQCVAVCCSVLQCVAVYKIASHCAACCSVLRCGVVCRSQHDHSRHHLGCVTSI